MSDEKRYANMQRMHYDQAAARWSSKNRNPVVGSFDEHNRWTDYDEYLFKDLGDTKRMIALDFGCGPGRNLVKFARRFRRIDGVDISRKNLDNAGHWCRRHAIGFKPQLHLCNGRDLSTIKAGRYNIVFSTIAMQHICMHSIRYRYLQEFHRVLTPGGWIAIQMGFGPQVPEKVSVGYRENFDAADSTNGGCDTRVESPGELRVDLEAVGFTDFRWWIRPTGPGDTHPNWIFFQARKPEKQA